MPTSFAGFRRLFASCRSAIVVLAGILVISASCPVPRASAQADGPITAPSTQSAPQNVPQAAPQAGHTNLAGTWQLNKKQSDDPRRKLQQAMGNGGNRGGGGGYGGPFGGGRRGPGGGGRAGGGQGGALADMEDYDQLTIEQSDSMAKVTGATGRVLALYSSGQDDANSASGSSYKPPIAQWQGDQLVVVNEAPRGNTKIRRTYQISSDGKQLDLTTTIDNRRMSQPVTIRFVYDAARSGSN